MNKHMPEITIKPLVPRGCEFVRDGKVLAEIFDPYLARLLEHAPEMLAVLKLIIGYEQTEDGHLALQDAIAQGVAIVVRVEGE